MFLKMWERTVRGTILGATVLRCIPCAAEFHTYVERGPVEPYASSAETVFLQGCFTTDSLPDPPSVKLVSASDMQSTEDVLMALVTSDEEFILTPLNDCWTAGFEEEYCCDVGGDPACFGGIFTHKRCCTCGKAGRTYLSRHADAARVLAGQIIPRYRIDEARLEARRLRFRHGKQPGRCAYTEFPVPTLPDKFHGNPETGLRAAFAVLASNGFAARRALHIGIRDGKSLDPLYPLIMTEGFTGLGIEADPVMANRSRANLPRRFKVEQGFATPTNIWTWAQGLGPLDVVVVDIDSFDCAVLEGLLSNASSAGAPLPALLHFETNLVIPPPFQFARGFDPDWLGRPERVSDQQLATSSCSLSYAVAAFERWGYDLLMFGYDSIFARRDLRKYFEDAWGEKLPRDEFQCYRRSIVHAISGPLRAVREWFFRADDPDDLQRTLELMSSNVSVWTAFEHLQGLPWTLFLSDVSLT